MGFGWHPIHEMENKSHVWNHQPEKIGLVGKELNDGKNYRKALYLIVKTMVSWKFSLKPIQWANRSGSNSWGPSSAWQTQPTSARNCVFWRVPRNWHPFCCPIPISTTCFKGICMGKYMNIYKLWYVVNISLIYGYYMVIWLMIVNNNLVGGFNLPLWEMMEFVS